MALTMANEVSIPAHLLERARRRRAALGLEHDVAPQVDGWAVTPSPHTRIISVSQTSGRWFSVCSCNRFVQQTHTRDEGIELAREHQKDAHHTEAVLYSIL